MEKIGRGKKERNKKFLRNEQWYIIVPTVPFVKYYIRVENDSLIKFNLQYYGLLQF